MTAVTESSTRPTPRRPPTTPPSPTLHAARWLLRQHLSLAAWAVGVFVVVVVTVVVLVDRYGNVETSIVQFARQGSIWFPFSTTIGVLVAYLNVHVAAGMTRRSLGRASLVAALTMAAFYTVVMTVALQVERAVYGSRDWAQQLTDEAPVFSDTSQVGWILVDLGLVFAAAQLCGLLVAITYYRFGGWWGTLTLPLTVGPVFGVTPLLTTSLLDPLSEAARVPIAVGLLVAVAAAYLALLHRVAIRPVAA